MIKIHLKPCIKPACRKINLKMYEFSKIGLRPSPGEGDACRKINYKDFNSIISSRECY